MPRGWWDELSLEQLDGDQWENLCDGCGQCCLVKTWVDGRLKSCAVGCRLLDTSTARCGDYHNRREKIMECIKLVPGNVMETGLLPRTCAYRLRAEGKPLPDWHHLNSGDRGLVHRVGIGIIGRITHTEATVRVRDYARLVFERDAWE